MSQSNEQFINSLFTRVLGCDQSLEIKKPKMVFLHGLLGNSQNWISLARDFEKDFSVLLVDQRGHGKSHHPSSYQPEDFAQDLKDILDEMKWEKVHLIGHSLGARVAFSFADLYSERLSSLVLEDMGPHKTGEASVSTEEMIKSVLVPFESRGEAKNFFEEHFKPLYGEVLSSYLYSNLTKTPHGGLDWRFSLQGALECIEVGQNRDFWKEFKNINVPTLLIRGERSEHLPLKIYQEMLRENSNVEGVEVSDSGHWVHFEQKDAFLSELKNFFQKF